MRITKIILNKASVRSIISLPLLLSFVFLFPPTLFNRTVYGRASKDKLYMGKILPAPKILPLNWFFQGGGSATQQQFFCAYKYVKIDAGAEEPLAVLLTYFATTCIGDDAAQH